MAVLGIDCSTKYSNIGVAESNMILGETSLELGRRQSAELPVMVSQLLEETGTPLSGITLIAAACGPGYYTGIRTGIAYAAALARALGKRIVPLDTTELFVYDLSGCGQPLAPVMKARRSSVYCALYKPCGDFLKEIIRPQFCEAAQFAQELRDYPDAILVGDDVKLFDVFLELPNKAQAKTSTSGGQAALMGEKYADRAIEPQFVRGNYIREPDIGPTFHE